MYYLDNGLAESASEAADKAYNEVINDRYEFRQSGDVLGMYGNTYRIPTEIDGISPDADEIDEKLDSIINLVPKMSLMAPADARIESDELREQI